MERDEKEIKFIDTGEVMKNGELGYIPCFNTGIVNGVRRRGKDLYAEDPDGVQTGGYYPGFADSR